MTRYSKTMSEALADVYEKFESRGYTTKQVKMAIGIASDKRYAGGNYTGAVNAIEKIKKGLSKHPQVAAVLKRQNEDIQEDGHTDVKSAKNQVKIAMTALQKMEMELGKLNDEDSLPSWWTNKVAVAVDNIDGMSDYLDTQVEEVDLDEMKMDDPKLVRKFDKLKRGDTVKLKTSSTISKGTDFVDYVVKAKNTVNKGRVEKITLVTKGNEKAVKKFLYKRDGKVTFAIGDMGASIDDIKEAAHTLAEKLKVSDGIGAWIKDFMKSDAPQFDGKNMDARRKMAIAAFADAGGKLEETELDEALKYHFAVVDPEGKVAGMSTSEREAKDIASRHKGKVVKLKKPMATKTGDMMINRPLKEGTWALPDSPKSKAALKKLMSKPIKLGKEGDNAADLMYSLIGDDELFDDLYVAGKKNPNGDARDVIKKAMKRLGIKEEDEKKMDKPDSAKAVDQARDDKKKTRIAQLQLQIAKATEMINKLNSQEKPDA